MTTISDELIEPEAFNEAFFASLAHRGIKYFNSDLDYNQGRVLEIDAPTALAYVFAEPAVDVSRFLGGLECIVEQDFLKLVKQVKRCQVLRGRGALVNLESRRNGRSAACRPQGRD